MSEKGSTLGRDPSLSCEREQRSEGRLILVIIRAAANDDRRTAAGDQGNLELDNAAL